MGDALLYFGLAAGNHCSQHWTGNGDDILTNREAHNGTDYRTQDTPSDRDFVLRAPQMQMPNINVAQINPAKQQGTSDLKVQSSEGRKLKTGILTKTGSIPRSAVHEIILVDQRFRIFTTRFDGRG